MHYFFLFCVINNDLAITYRTKYKILIMKNYKSILKNNSFYFLLMIVFLSTTHLFAQKEYMLWEVKGNNLDNPSYILGVITNYNADKVLNELDDVLKTTDQLVLDAKRNNSPEETAKIQQLVIDQANASNFYDLFDKETITKLDAFFTKNYGADFQRLSAYKPFMVNNLINSRIIPPYDITTKLSKLVQEYEKDIAIVGLETIEEQIKEFDKVPVKEFVTAITKSISNLDDLKEKFDLVATYYKKQDVEAIFKEIQGLDLNATETAKVMLVDRNKKWLPKLESLMFDKSSFITVGLTHMLPFEGNLKSLLENKGYEVTLIK